MVKDIDGNYLNVGDSVKIICADTGSTTFREGMLREVGKEFKILAIYDVGDGIITLDRSEFYYRPQSLRKVVNEMAHKYLPVDTLLRVGSAESNTPQGLRYLKEISKGGSAICFKAGRTSKTSKSEHDCSVWYYWEVAY